MALVEPLRELFKDEVRVLGRELGLPERAIGRHRFPDRAWRSVFLAKSLPINSKSCVRQIRYTLRRFRNGGLYDEIWQAFAVLLPVRTVGAMGDERTYDFVCALRAVTSTDGMTADYYPFEQDFLGRVANRIVNEVRGINRVVYDITSKPRARSSGNSG